MPFNATELVNITPYVNKSDGTKISSTTSYTINLGLAEETNGD